MSSIKTTTDQGVLVVDFTESELVDQFEAREIGHELTELANEANSKMLLTLENVDFMSSAMVGQLFVLSQKCRAKKVTLKICAVPDVIKQVFGIVRLDNFIELYEDVPRALAAFTADESRIDGEQSATLADDHREAAAKGDAEAQFAPSLCYEEGRGVASDEDEAQRWLESAAKLGNLGAQYRMGHAYAFGIRVGQDYDEAIKWYQPAAERGHVEAQYSMGMSFQYGIGVSEDVGAARQWYRMAADQGHVKAAEAIGKLSG